VMTALRAINREDGITVICNLHTLDVARTYCDRIIGMAWGKLVFDGPPSALTAEIAQAIYGGDKERAEVHPSAESDSSGGRDDQNASLITVAQWGHGRAGEFPALEGGALETVTCPAGSSSQKMASPHSH
jgi:ABC-type multidrug transport system ATPase subunit